MPTKLLDRVSYRWAPAKPAEYSENVEYSPATQVLDTWSGDICQIGVTPGVFTLSGKVTDATTGKAIAGVSITLDTKTATTNQDGSYSFANLAAATYNIAFAKTGYNSVTRNVAISKDTILDIQLTVGVAEEKKAFPWLILGIAGGSLALIAIAATRKKK